MFATFTMCLLRSHCVCYVHNVFGQITQACDSPAALASTADIRIIQTIEVFDTFTTSLAKSHRPVTTRRRLHRQRTSRSPCCPTPRQQWKWHLKQTASLQVPYRTLCPCSLNVSAHNVHNVCSLFFNALHIELRQCRLLIALLENRESYAGITDCVCACVCVCVFVCVCVRPFLTSSRKRSRGLLYGNTTSTEINQWGNKLV